MTRSLLLTLLVLFTCIAPAGAAAPAYGISGRIAVGGTGHWDYITADPLTRRLYVGHDTRLEILDIDGARRVGSVRIDGFAHGFAVAPGTDLGFVTNGTSALSTSRAHEVDVVDMRSLRVVKKISVAQDPDGIVYDAAARTIIAFTGDSQMAILITPQNGGRVVGTIALPGSPEAAVTDRRGRVFVNIADKNEIAELDLAHRSVVRTLPLRNCFDPAGLALDESRQRLFIGCRNGALQVIRKDTGREIARVPTAPKNDGVAYDALRGRVFVSTLSGQLSVIRASNEVSTEQTVRLPVGSRTLALDPRMGRIYVPAARFSAIPPGSKYPLPVPHTFCIIAVAPVH